MLQKFEVKSEVWKPSAPRYAGTKTLKKLEKKSVTTCAPDQGSGVTLGALWYLN